MFVFILNMPVAAQTAMPEGAKNMPDSTTAPAKHASLASHRGKASSRMKNDGAVNRRTGQPDELGR
jgi:hypothetical protein